MNRKRRGFLYRSRRGVIFGVCRGIAERFDISLFWVRALVVFAALVSTFWPVVLFYLLAAILMKPEPVIPLSTEADVEFYDSYTTSRSMALHRLKRLFDRLDRRVRRMEDFVTSAEYTWDKKYNQM